MTRQIVFGGLALAVSAAAQAQTFDLELEVIETNIVDPVEFSGSITLAPGAITGGPDDFFGTFDGGIEGFGFSFLGTDYTEADAFLVDGEASFGQFLGFNANFFDDATFENISFESNSDGTVLFLYDDSFGGFFLEGTVLIIPSPWAGGVLASGALMALRRRR